MNGAAVILVAAALVSGGAMAQDAGQQLIEAAKVGDVARATDIIRAGAPLETRDGQGRTALLIAVERNDVPLAKVLMGAGASLNTQAANADTPWVLAGARGRNEMIADMIPLGPDLLVRNRFGGNALIPACERAHIETIRLLLTTKIDVNHVNNLGWTCLLEIVILGDGGPRHQEAARLVLAAGAAPNLGDKDGVTPLAHARARGQGEVAALIEQAGGRSR